MKSILPSSRRRSTEAGTISGDSIGIIGDDALHATTRATGIIFHLENEFIAGLDGMTLDETKSSLECVEQWVSLHVCPDALYGSIGGEAHALGIGKLAT